MVVGLTFVTTWILNQQEARLRRRLVKKSDNRALRHLLAFTVKHNRQLPLHDVQLRNALFGVNSWQTDIYQEPLFAIIETYLFQDVQQTTAYEWHVWLRESQLLQRPIRVNASSTAKAIWEAYTSGKLIEQVPFGQDYSYLAECYQQTYLQVLSELGAADLWESFPILLEYAASARYLESSEYSQWIRVHREKLVRDRFIRKASLRTLTDLLDFVIHYEHPFPIDDPPVRESLFSLNFWKIEKKYQELLFLCVEGYLFANLQQSHRDEWKVWLSASRQANRRIKVMSLLTGEALLEACNAGKLVDLPQEDYDYLLKCYFEDYKETLEKAEPQDAMQALPVLFALATVVQLTGPDESYKDILKRWEKRLPRRPRSLGNMDDEQAFRAPPWGVGSPHRVSITICRDPASSAPVRITCAGHTGDATLNAHIFTDLFAGALACDNEPTFLMPNGCTLSLQRQLPTSTDGASAPLLSAVIGPSGPVQPAAQTPTLGMDIQEAMLLITGTFEYYQDVTGLVQVKQWQKADADEFERRVRDALLVRDGAPYEIDFNDIRPEEAGVIHTVPLLHRDHNGAVLPIEIEIPYHLLGAAKVFDLLYNARLGYIEQLITAGERRQAFAERAYEEQNKLVNRWQSYTDEEKQRRIQQQPFVTIAYEVDFNLGITKKYDEPKEQLREFYEEETRPQLRDSAWYSARRYAALIRKLQTFNAPGGIADILTFKLLLDAMLREASLPIAHAGFQKQYKEWVTVSTIPVWAAVQQWALKRGLSAETLAADNILFNSRLQIDTQTIVIQPWVMVDLHDSVIHIDSTNGLMEVLPGSQTVTLADTLTLDANHGIHSLKSLHDTFCMWAREVFSRQAKYIALRSEISNDRRFYAVVQLKRARQFLFHGNLTQAINIFGEIRRDDLAPIYFWAAVAQQGQLVKANPARFIRDYMKLSTREQVASIGVSSLEHIIGYIRELSDPHRTISGWDRSLIDQNIRSDLEKLRAKDRQAIDKLASLREESETYQWIFQWERQSLGLSPEEETRADAAISALAAIELLDLAENMKNTAKDIPFTGEIPNAIRRDLDEIVAKSRLASFESTSIEGKLEDVINLYHRSGQEQVVQPRRQARFPVNAMQQQANPTKDKRGSDDPVMSRVRSTILGCCEDIFENDQTLRSVFVDERISEWKDNLPEANSLAMRANGFIEFMYNQYHWKTKDNGLVLGLKILSGHKDRQDACHQELLQMAQEVERILPGDTLVNQNVTNALHASHHLVIVATNARIEGANAQRLLDPWETAALKRYLHVLCESIAQLAKDKAGQASSIYAYDLLEILVPVIVDLRWQRGYAASLTKLLSIPVSQKHLKEFRSEAIDPSSPVREGVVLAERTETGDVLVQLDGHPVVLVHNLPSIDMQVVVDAVNNYGRLGPSETDGLSLLERIGQIPIHATVSSGEPVARALRVNRDVLILLIARLGITGYDHLLRDEEDFPKIGQPLLTGKLLIEQ